MVAGPRLALFDCDGTLVDSQANICIAIERSFGEFDLPQPGNHAARRVVGLSLQEAMRRLHPDGDDVLLTELAERYRNHYLSLSRERDNGEPLYPGIVELLGALRGAGWILGVATGKSLRGLERVLGLHHIASYFSTLQVADHHPSKPHPSMVRQAMAETDVGPESTVLIGDTVFDMEMARAAGTGAIGVDWGYHEPAELRKAGASDIARDAAHLKALLEGMAG